MVQPPTTWTMFKKRLGNLQLTRARCTQELQKIDWHTPFSDRREENKSKSQTSRAFSGYFFRRRNIEMHESDRWNHGMITHGSQCVSGKDLSRWCPVWHAFLRGNPTCPFPAQRLGSTAILEPHQKNTFSTRLLWESLKGCCLNKLHPGRLTNRKLKMMVWKMMFLF